MTEDAIRAALARLGEQIGGMRADIARLDEKMSSHMAQQTERTTRRDGEIKAINTRIDEIDDDVKGIREWKVKVIASSTAIGAAVALAGNPIVTALTAAAAMKGGK